MLLINKVLLFAPGHPEATRTAIVGIGNVLRHEYQRLHDGRLWDIATVNLPQLHPVILHMLAQFES